MNERRIMVTEAVWKTIVLAYSEPRQNEDEISIPAGEAVSALMTCAAHIIAGVPDPSERASMIAQLSPIVGRAVTDSGTGRNLLTPQNGIVLPN